MKQSLLVCLTLLFGLAADGASADNNKVKQVPAGKVAWHFVTNLTFPDPFLPPELVGYIAFIEGVNGPMFSHQFCPLPGIPGVPLNGCVEDAFFTLRIRPFSGGPLIILDSPDPAVVQGALLSGGLMFDIYLDRDPNMIPQTWADLDSFSDGELVATFQESALMTATTVEGGLFNLFSSDLIFSRRFEFNGQKIDFKKLVPNGVTSTNFGSANSGAAIGTAIARGGRKRQHD